MQTVKLKCLEDIKQLVIRNTFSGRNHRSTLLQNKCRKQAIKTSTKELLSKLQAKSLKNHQNDIVAVMKTKRHFATVASEIKTMLQSRRKYPRPNPKSYRNQPIISSCKSIVWSSHNTIVHQRCLQADHNETFQDMKKNNRKSLAEPELYSEHP